MRILVIGLLLLVLVGAAWSALWFYAAHEAGTRFDAWMRAEDEQGRSWTCPDRAIGGYPLAVTISCAKPTYTGKTPDQIAQGTLAALVAEAAVTHPHSLIIALQSPLTYKTSDGQADVKARWSSAAIEVEGLASTQSITLRGKDLVVDGQFGETGHQGGNAARLDATFSTQSDTTPTVDFTIAVQGSTIPPLDDILGGQVPVDIDLAGRLNRTDIGNPRTPEEAIEAWRQAGGRIDLASSRLVRADSSVTGSGILMLDDAHRPQGRIDASFVGLEPILKRYGISGNLAAAGSLLSTLFGGGPPSSAAPATPGALNLPISFNNGRLGIGPIRTPVVLQPLY